MDNRTKDQYISYLNSIACNCPIDNNNVVDALYCRDITRRMRRNTVVNSINSYLSPPYYICDKHNIPDNLTFLLKDENGRIEYDGMSSWCDLDDEE